MYHICISFMWISKIRIVQKNRPFPPFGKILELCPIDGLIRRWNRLQKSFRSKVARLQFLKRRPDIYLAKILPKIPSKKLKRVTKHILDIFLHFPEKIIIFLDSLGILQQAALQRFEFSWQGFFLNFSHLVNESHPQTFLVNPLCLKTQTENSGCFSKKFYKPFKREIYSNDMDCCLSWCKYILLLNIIHPILWFMISHEFFEVNFFHYAPIVCSW